MSHAASLARLPELGRHDDTHSRGIPVGVLAWGLAAMAPLFLPAKVCTAAYLLIAGGLLLKHGLFGRAALRHLVGPLLLIGLLGCLQDWSSIELRFFAQDFWRASKPLLILFLGYASVVILPARIPFRLLVASVGLGYALIYLARLALECVLRGAMPLDLADIVVFGHFPEAMALGVCLRYPRLGLRPSGSLWLLRRVTVVVVVTALLLSGSRTWLIAAGVMALAGSGWMRGRGRWRAVLLIGPILVAVLFTPFGQMLFSKGFDVALAELSPARYVEMADINSNWRGYEAYQGLQAYSSGSSSQKLLGQGFGAQADLGLFMELGDAEFHEIGQFHNGFVWLLLKTGWAGLGLYAVWIWRLFGFARRLKQRGQIEQADLLQGVILTVIFTTLVISGIYNPVSNDGLLLVMGGLVAALFKRPQIGSTTQRLA